MALGKAMGILILCAIAVLIFFFLNRKTLFTNIKGEKIVKVASIIITYVVVTGVLYGFCMLIWFAIHLIVG